MKLNLKDKVVLVTGGSRGIGKAICLAFAEEGAKVVVNYLRNRELAEETVAKIKEKYQVGAIAVKADMSCEQEVLDMIASAEKELGTVDILVNNAAYCPSGPIASYTSEEWDKTFAINMRGTFLASRELIKEWQSGNKKGVVVNIASQAAFRGSTSGHLPYDSSKGAMVSFTIGLAREVAKQGIRVNAVAPGLVRTEMVAETWEKKKEKYLERIPLYRIAEPEEIARIAVFLASDAASYITGATIDASGGMMMR
ncbi:SDR family NAD(P)-dependent oxidoreductase [Maribellus maritimus]|uniref:SDR family NAD(P)-dependent oxidoreductase n=1 Tax=Maribellus maritimus TaxID=2870838 RepID=UPI001EEB6BE8|nr:3-oxoacyl-ACP reductase family protein [Maribellus maritimus]MCG6189524.1 3-oxoacyl-ACP reductase FabG [Maribellus maritimus]